MHILNPLKTFMLKHFKIEFFISQRSATDFRERISDKYSRIHVVLDGDERLMMQIIDAEEAYMTEWLDAQRDLMEVEINDIDRLRASTKTLLQETNNLRFLQVFESHTQGYNFYLKRHELFLFYSK